MAEQGSGKWWAVAAVVVALVGIGIGFIMSRSSPSPAGGEAATAPAAANASAPGKARPAAGSLDPRRRVPAPAQRVPEHGRISVTLAEVRAAPSFAIALGMPDEARGDEALEVIVVDAEGRRYDASAPLIEGEGTGLRLEIESEWLRAGRYLIHVNTVEKAPLAARRYVLEVR